MHCTNLEMKTVPAFMVLTCRWRSRPQHQKRPLMAGAFSFSPWQCADGGAGVCSCHTCSRAVRVRRCLKSDLFRPDNR